MEYAEALRARCAEVRRMAQKQRQMQDGVKQDIQLCKQESAQLRDEALQLQLQAREQRQASKLMPSTKFSDAKTLRKEAEHRQHQIQILTHDLAQKQADTSQRVEIALAEAAQAASTRDLHMELQWKGDLETELQRLRDTESRSRKLEKELRDLHHELQSFPLRTALVQLSAVLDDLRLRAQAAKRKEDLQRTELELMNSWERQGQALREARLQSLAEDLAQQRSRLAQRAQAQQEEAAEEEKELRERLARNQRRTDRAERELAKYKAAKEAAGRPQGEASVQLPQLLTHPNRSAPATEFSVLGALKALDQEGNDRFGLLRR